MEGEEHYSPAEAAKILRLTPHRLRQMLNASDLEGEQESGEKGGSLEDTETRRPRPARRETYP